jgi:HAE1 family hydrophobic/amphiphilic exporter-1
VRIKDVAKVELGQQTFTTFSGLSGKKAAQMNVYTLPGANALEVARAVHDAMEEMRAHFPEGLEYTALLDTSKFIQDSIHGVYMALFEAGILVLLVIMLFLQNGRAVLVPATTVPVTIIGAFAAMALLGFTVNLMTLFALILAIGIVVDDAIVIVENASHHIERGLSPKDAAIAAMEELTGPVLGITLVLTAVFLPASFLPGITGQMFRQFALVIAATALISAMNALTLKPAQCALYLRPLPPDRRVNRLYEEFNRIYGALEARYVGVVERMARHPYGMLGAFCVIVAFAALLFARHPDRLPADRGPGLLPRRRAAPARGVAAARARNGRAHRHDPEGPARREGLGHERRLLGARRDDALERRHALRHVRRLGRAPARRDTGGDHADLREGLRAIRSADFSVLVPPPVPGLGQAGGFEMMIEDRSSAGLRELEKAVQALLLRADGEPALRGVTTAFNVDSPQLYLDIDRTMVESLGVSINDVFGTLQTYLGSSYVNRFNKFNQSFEVRVQAGADYRRRMEDIAGLYVANRSGQMVPLGAFIGVRRALGSELITRYELYPSASIVGGAAPGFSSGQAIGAMEDVANATLPPGVGYDWTGLAYQEKLVGSQVYFIFGLSATLVFLVLAALYESWSRPAVVVLAVPMALVGIVLALIVRGFAVDLYTQIGLVLMIALAAKNAILVVEFATALREEGKPMPEAAVEAVRRRFRPIVMTSIAFILGVVPLLTASGAGAASQQALGTVVFGGMLASTLLAIPFVPAFLIIVDEIDIRRAARKAAVPAPVPQAGT